MAIDIRQGDCLDLLRQMPSESVHACVTSPPYFALRDYGCEGQIGLEGTPEAFVGKLVEVFAEVRRVLRADGVAFVNMGDSYAAGAKNRTPEQATTNSTLHGGLRGQLTILKQQSKVTGDLKPKDLIGIPWMLAFALRADGWYLRQEIIWHKPSPMPESVQDRCTKAHEQIFLLTKSARYYFDAAAIREEAVEEGRVVKAYPLDARTKTTGDAANDCRTAPGKRGTDLVVNGRNKRSVWTVATQPCSLAHFATFPPKLIEPMILAGTSAMGCCAACGSPLVRQTAKTTVRRERPNQFTSYRDINGPDQTKLGVSVETTGWAPSCECGAETEPCTVLDPFSGAGTTALVAGQLGRSAIGLELNPQYVAMSLERLSDAGVVGLFA